MVKRISILWAAGLLGLALIIGIAAAVTLSAHSVHAAPLASASFTCNPDVVVSANDPQDRSIQELIRTYILKNFVPDPQVANQQGRIV